MIDREHRLLVAIEDALAMADALEHEMAGIHLDAARVAVLQTVTAAGRNQSAWRAPGTPHAQAFSEVPDEDGLSVALGYGAGAG